MLKTVYPAELLDLFPDKEIDKSSARTWFMSQGVGQAAADKMIALFTFLKNGEIKEKKVTNGPKKNGGTPKKTESKNKTLKEAPGIPMDATIDKTGVSSSIQFVIALICILICKYIFPLILLRNKLSVYLQVWQNTYMEGMKNEFRIGYSKHCSANTARFR